jgi:hypothetical protein
MPDFTVEVAPICQSNKDWERSYPSSDGKSSYRVRFGYSPHGRYQYDWSCECVGFRTRKQCKHVEAAKKDRCAWNWELEPRPMPENRVCPDCGGPLDFVRVAV